MTEAIGIGDKSYSVPPEDFKKLSKKERILHCRRAVADSSVQEIIEYVNNRKPNDRKNIT